MSFREDRTRIRPTLSSSTCDLVQARPDRPRATEIFFDVALAEGTTAVPSARPACFSRLLHRTLTSLCESPARCSHTAR